MSETNKTKLDLLAEREPLFKVTTLITSDGVVVSGYLLRASRVKELVRESPGMSDANKQMIIDALDRHLVRDDTIESVHLGLFMALAERCVPDNEYRPLRFALSDQNKNPIIQRHGQPVQ